MKFLFFILLFINLLFPFSAKSQELNIDSLKQLLNTNLDDTTRLKVKIDIGQEVLIYRISYWDSLLTDCENILKKSNSATEKEITTYYYAQVSNNIGYIYKFYGDIKSAEKYYKQSIRLNLSIRNTNDSELKNLALQDLAQTLNNLAVIIVDQGNNERGLQLYEFTLKVRLFLDDKEGAALTLNNMAYVTSNYGDIEKAMNYYYESLKIREAIDDQHGIGQVYGNLASLHAEQKDFEEALNNHLKALKIYIKLKDDAEIAHVYNNIGTNYMMFGKLDSCEYYYLKAYEIRKRVNYKSGIANSLYSLGRLFAEKKDYNQAISYYNECLATYEKLQYKIKICQTHQFLSEVYYVIGNNAKATEHSQKAYQLAKELEDTKQIAAAAKSNYFINKKDKKFEDALYMLETHIKMRDSISNEENKKVLLKQIFKHKYEKQKSIDDIEHEKSLAIEQEAKKNQRIIIYAIIIGLLLVVFFLIVIYNRLQLTKKQKIIIEEKKNEVEAQKEIVDEKNKEILDSIVYAKRIQSAILPPLKVVKQYLQESFILYKPKDIVAGDFYWMEHKNGEILFAAADCTGHGVPGAMVSVICNNGLNRSVREHGLTEPGKILDKTREIVIEEFEKSEEEVKDGMDIALCSLRFDVQSLKLDKQTSNLESETAALLQYAGANNPLWIVTNCQSELVEDSNNSGWSILRHFDKLNAGSQDDTPTILEIKANKQPIGKYDNPTPYTTHTIPLQKGDTFYVFSDGYVDQFGGEKGKKFKSVAFKKLLLDIQSESMDMQKQLIDEAFEQWKGSLEQIDDVCVIGVRV